MDTQQRIGADLKEAMKARDEPRKAVLRSLKAELDKERIDSGADLDERKVAVVLQRARKQRIEAAEIFSANGALDKAAVETAEAKVIEGYLPKQLAQEDIAKLIDDAIATSGASGPGDQGKVMGRLAKALAGQADLKAVAAQVKARLGS